MALAPAEATFLTALITELVHDSPRREFDNVDPVRFPSPPAGFRTLAKNRLLRAAAAQGFYRASAFRQDLLDEVLKIPGLAEAYDLLEDQPSRELFVKLIAYRVLGERHVRLPANNAKYWHLRRSVGQYVEKRGVVKDIPVLGSLDLCKINNIRMQVFRLTVLHIFLLEQYRCERAGVGVRQGDTVIDGGGSWGDTALYFAQKADRVFSFECMPSNLKILRENLALNPTLAPKIDVVEKALWRRSGERFVFQEEGAGSRPASDGHGVAVETETIDGLVAARSVGRVDFIKMDIEGSEPEALVGGEQTIRRDRPQLAISIYHDLAHFASIPRWIAGLNLGYRFYLDHFTIHSEETVLFARCELPKS